MNERPVVEHDRTDPPEDDRTDPHEEDRTDQHIGAEGTEPIGEARRSGAPRVRSADEELDAALACTFPASDPISCFRPSPDDGCAS